ncbi:MAG: PIG-L family deacetylase, partial [Candidatus Dormibacteraceae bacterium]
HAHPDDESIGTGGTILRAHLAGHRVVLVTATRGELGEIHNLDAAATRPVLGQVREAELRSAAEVLGIDRLVFLGYRDSGMAGLVANDEPGSFHAAPLEEAAERLARVLREERPLVVVTYSSHGTYGHPDHVKAHETTVAALALLHSEGWEPDRYYEEALPQSVVDEVQRRIAAAGVTDVPAAQLVGVPDGEITVRLDVRDLASQKQEALARHVSQMDPAGPWTTMQGQTLEAALGWEHYILVGGDAGPRGTATSLV